jgi:hypothetical protein
MNLILNGRTIHVPEILIIFTALKLKTMKKTIFTLIILCFANIIVSGQTADSQKKDPVGQWKFDAPSAPEGYNSGTIAVSLSEKKNNATISFTGSENKFQGDNVRVEKDSLFFSVYIEGENVNLSLKIEDNGKMSGKAVYSEGVIQVTLTRGEEKKN